MDTFDKRLGELKLRYGTSISQERAGEDEFPWGTALGLAAAAVGRV
jgi:hypothetical protein